MPRTKKADQKKDATKTNVSAPEEPEQTEGTAPAQETPEAEAVEEVRASHAKTNPEDALEKPGQEMFAKLPNPCVYCGPTVRGVARQYTTYQGGISDTLRNFIMEHPEARQLIVSTSQFPTMRKRLDTPGTAEAKLYKRVKAQL